jgi:hypothetical protein
VEQGDLVFRCSHRYDIGAITGDAPSFTGDEIAIYRDFLLHYPKQLSNMIGMQDTTVAFVTSAPAAEIGIRMRLTLAEATKRLRSASRKLIVNFLERPIALP